MSSDLVAAVVCSLGAFIVSMIVLAAIDLVGRWRDHARWVRAFDQEAIRAHWAPTTDQTPFTTVKDQDS